MQVSLLGALALATAGRAVRLTFDVRRPPAQRIQPRPDWCDPPLTDRLFNGAIELAFRHTVCAVGWPANASFDWKLAAADPQVSLPVTLEGDSLFGAFVLGLMQSVLRAEPECAIQKTLPLTQAIKGTCLKRVAVTARWDTPIARFGPVEDIEKKLESLAMLGGEVEQRCAACVVEKGQCIGRVEEKTCESYVSKDGSRRLPLVRAYDPADAFAKLFEFQVRDVVRRLLP